MSNRLSIILSTLGVFILPVNAMVQISEEPVPTANGFFDRLVRWVENSYLYRRYVCDWPSPLNNASFDATLLLIIAFALLWSVYGFISNAIFRIRAKKRADEIRRRRELEGTDIDPITEGTEKQEEPVVEEKHTEDQETEMASEVKEQGTISESSPKTTRKPDAEEIKAKYTHVPQASELVDLEDNEKVVSIAESSIVKRIEVPKEEKKEDKEERQAVDVAKLLEEKTAENTKRAETTTYEQQNRFAELVASLDNQRASDLRAKETERAAEEAIASNLEALKNDLENAISEETSAQKTTNKWSSDDSALSAAQKAALRQREKERLKAEKRGKK